MSEYLKIVEEYPHISFSDNPSKRNKEHSLFQLEAANIVPSNYDENIITQYKKIYTWNGKLFDEYIQKGFNVVKVPNFPLFDNYHNLGKFLSYEERIDGICLICRYRESHVPFDLSSKRVEVFNEIEGITKHAYGKIEYCSEHYKGQIGQDEHETYPSSLAKLEVLNKYKFNLCFENVFDERWGWDYVTEKITDCFKAKTVPVYYGCYNIEQRIPKELYVDFREYSNTKDLVKYLKEFDKNKFIQMTEDAFIWNKENKLGDIDELKVYLDND